MRQIFAGSASAFRNQHVGQELEVLWEKASPKNDGEWELCGLSDNYLRVRATSPSPCHNQIMKVRIMGVEQDGLVGEISSPDFQELAAQDTL